MTGDLLVERLRALLDDRELTIDELPWLCGCGHCDASDARDEALRTIQAHRRLLEMHAECGSGSGRCDDGGHWTDDETGMCAEYEIVAAIYLPDIETGDTPNEP